MRLGTRAMRVGDARVLDRLVRGRAWIALMAIGLLGIVFMQVSLLKLNAGISRAVTAADTFDRQNSSLREDISKLDSGERIQSVAAKLGMVTPAAGDVHYLDGREADGARAAAAIKPPKPVTPNVAPAPTSTTPPATTTAPPATTPATTAPAAAADGAPAATTAGAPATTSTAPASTTNTAPASGGGAPANAAPATGAPAQTAPTAPTATGWAESNSAGGASAPQGGQG
jgi:hypothetical protein